ncbi:MAG: monovalent cation/H+ antiporter subunit D, partial [Gemmobacter sp.]
SLREARPPFPGSGLLAALFFAGAIAMAGMPPLSGFVGKLLILDALRGAPAWGWLWAAVLITSLVAIVGMARAGSLVFWKAHAVEGEARAIAVQPWAVAALGLLLALIVAQTVFAGPLMAWFDEIAAELLDGGAYVEAVLGLGEE